MAVERIAAIQALVIGLIFAWAGKRKLFSPEASIGALNSALNNMLLRREWTLAANRLIGAGELVVAALLLVSPWHWFGIRMATVFTVGFIGYLVMAWRIAPNQSCGCMGGRVTKISRCSVLRAALLLALTVIGWRAQEYWASALIAAPWIVLPIAIEVLAVWRLSPELGRPAWSMRHRFIRAIRSRLDPDCSGVALDWETMEAQLRNSATFQQLISVVGARTDRWREDCWGFLSYAATYNERDATAVFAMPVLFDPRDVSAAVLDDTTNTTVFASPAVNGARPPEAPLITEVVESDRSPSAA